MAISYVGGQASGRTTTAGNAGNTTAVTFSFSGGSNSTPSAGDLVVVTIAVGSQARNQSMALTAQGYTDLTQLNPNTVTYDTSMMVSYKIMGSTPDTAVTIPAPQGGGADSQCWTIQCFRGVDSSIPMDATAAPATGTATGRPNPASISPATSGAYVVICGAGAAAAGATYTAPANYTTNWLTNTQADTNDTMIGSGYRAWTSGAEDPAAYTGGTTGANDSWAAYTLALKPGLNHVTTNGEPGSYTLTGSAATATRQKLTNGEAGSYALTGSAATAGKSLNSVASPDSYTLAGSATTTLRTHISVASAGSYSLTGSATTVTRALISPASAGSYALTGAATAALRGHVSIGTGGAYTLTGSDATATQSASAATSPGSYTLDGAPATGLRALLTSPEAGIYVLSGQPATAVRELLGDGQPGSYALLGALAEGTVSGSALDMRVSRIEFDTLASALDMRASWIVFDTQAAPMDMRLSWVTLDMLAADAANSDWIIRARRRGRR